MLSVFMFSYLSTHISWEIHEKSLSNGMLGDGFVHAMHFWKDVIHLELIIRDLHHKPLKNKDKYFVSYILKHVVLMPGVSSCLVQEWH